ncbi:MAG TPA: hypothetical protein VLV86_20395 [Vicinamibacterales bacterium]|nr:hypothetical protein [Vicinamibacterales bacterium]
MINSRRAVIGVFAAGALSLLPGVGGRLSAQQNDQRPSVQVGVPEGRGPGGPAQGPAGRGRGRQAGPPPAPAPRNADGRVLLGGATPADKGVWLPGNGGFQGIIDPKDVPFQPWARAVFEDRQKNQLEPHTRCKPSGFARQFLTPYGVEFVELPEIDRVFIFDIGGPHTYREIFMDGRTHPATPTPSYYGHSIGWWEGDTLVADTIGYNEGFWIDRRGTPTTERLHTLERFTRTNAVAIKYEFTVDDPGAFTKPWSSGFDLRWENGTELFEYVCQQMNYAPSLMVGAAKSVDRTSAIVP